MATPEFKKSATLNLYARGFKDVEIIDESPADYVVIATATDPRDGLKYTVRLVAVSIYHPRRPHFRMTKKLLQEEA